MTPLTANRWKTDPDLLNFIIERTENVESPMSVKRMAREFKEKSGVAQTKECLTSRTSRIRTRIHNFENIDMNTKVKMMFALSASVDVNFLKKLAESAVVRVDKKNRITHYKTNDGSLELKGDHSVSAKTKTAQLDSKYTNQKLIRDYFKNRNNADAVSMNEGEKEMGDLIEFITEKCENVNSTLSICQLAKEFNNHIGRTIALTTTRDRIKKYGREIQKIDFLDTQSKVKQLFGLSATMDLDFLKQLRKDALVKVDDNKRITHYKAKDGSLELRGDHSRSAKNTSVKFDSKQSLQSLIESYFAKKKNADAAPENEKEKEMWHFIEFITEECDIVNSPLSIRQLVSNFNNKYGISRSQHCICIRVKTYCRVIQKTELLDTHSKAKQLFGLSATLDSSFLEELRRDAVVEVDNLNRITKYTANNGRLTLLGDHSSSGKKKLEWMERRKKMNTIKKNCSSGGNEDEESEKENEYSEDDSEEYSSEEFGSEFDSDDESTVLDETESLVKPPKGINDNDTPVKNRSSLEMRIEDNFDFDPPTERSPRSEETRMKKDNEIDSGITENSSVVTRSGRLSKRRHLDSEFSYNLANSSTSGTSTSTDSRSSKPAKQKKRAIVKEQASSSSNESRSSFSRNSPFPSISTKSGESMESQDGPEFEGIQSDYHRHRVHEMDDYDYNPREDNIPECSPIDNRLEELEQPAAEEQNSNDETQTNSNRADAVAPEPKPEKKSLQKNKNCTQPTNGKEVILTEAPVKIEREEPRIVENSTEDVKPKISHNSKTKFFNAMKSLILLLDIASLSDLQSKIHQKIRKLKRSNEVLQNNELIPALEFMIAKMTNQSTANLPKTVESVNFSHFLCYLKAAILNSKLAGLDLLLEKIKEQNKNLDLQMKSIPVETLASVLQTTMDIIGF